jgi:hypothetical protein
MARPSDATKQSTASEDDDTLALPDNIKNQITQLDNAPDEKARLALEASLVQIDVKKPVDPSQELSLAELEAVKMPKSTEQPASGMSASTKIIRAAKEELGYREQGGNCTKYGSWYGIHCAEWCDMFVSWVFHHVGLLSSIGGKFAYVPSHLDWFRKHKLFHKRGAKGGGPHLGGAIFFDWDGNGVPNHIGIVVSYTDTHVYTVEGNRSDKVSALTYLRSNHLILGYGYPNWK